MAAVTLVLDASAVRITLGAANVAQEVIFPANARRYRRNFVTDNGKIATSGTDGAAIGTDYETAYANSPVEDDVPWCVGRGRNLAGGKLYFATAAGSTVLEIRCYS